jgi:hypothetical protein
MHRAGQGWTQQLGEASPLPVTGMGQQLLELVESNA